MTRSTATTPHRTARRRRRAVMACLVGAVLAAAGAMPASAANAPQASVVSEVPASWTPQVEDGAVVALTQIGRTVVAGGTFTSVREAGSSTSLPRNGLFAFDALTGKIDTAFDAKLVNGSVNSLDNDGTSIYVGGTFGGVAGKTTQRRVAKLTPAGALAPGQPKTPNSAVSEVVVRGGRLYVGGAFTAVGTTPRSALAAYDATTGALLPDVALDFAGQYNGGTTTIKRFDVAPDGRTLVAVGNFLTVGGLPREQVVGVDLPATGPATVSAWSTDRFSRAKNSSCSLSFDSFVRDVDYSPDGRYFVVSTTGAFGGGSGSGTLCDSVSRWETAAAGTGAGAQPSWVDYTGGDTSYGVAVTGTAVYVGGHFRWFNNPYRADRQGPGAVSREGVAALDPRNGLPLAWNPGRTRGVGAQAMLATDAGLWVGSDTDRFNDRLRARIAFVPLTGGTSVAADDDPAPSFLHQHLYSVQRSGTLFTPAALQRTPADSLAAGTPAPTTVDQTVDWANTRGAFRVGSTLYYGRSTGLFARSFSAQGALGPERKVDLRPDPATGTAIPFSTGNLSGAFYDPERHRLYYTLTNDSKLYYRYFTPSSEVVGAVTFTAGTGGLDLRYVGGMTLSGGRVYYGSTSDGGLRSVAFSGGSMVSGTAVRVGTSTSWRGSGIFVGGPQVDQPPTAVARATCTDLTCSFDGTGSTDPDGPLASYTWDLGDGTTASGPTVSHTYASAASRTVRLTVTDSAGTSASTTATATTTPPPDRAPTAVATASCTDLSCTFDGSGSSDPDGPLARYTWQLGDGTTADGAVVSHTYTDPGERTATLVVTDSAGTTASATTVARTFAPATTQVAHRATASAGSTSSSVSVVVPAEVQAGDQLLLAVSTNRAAVSAPPAGVGDWTEAGRAVGDRGELVTTLWARTADGTEAGRPVVVQHDAATKSTAVLGAWSGAVVDAVAVGGSTPTAGTHVTPTVEAQRPGSWVVSVWSDKSSATTTWTPPVGVLPRATALTGGSGRVTALVADSGAPVAAGTAGGLAATTDGGSLKAAMLSVVLRPL
ncbi:PKD domain-containing protein [uncultured Pseudokineococcus sp.]|uniref:PKD domain-containing protein n=1 Tax=uncultured Pseudokineococcus sp. TaxID=1642928 RepID=UPI002627909B|nr:PKD domain-containing protein [uncultured Pseudokineococcus sp.]